MNSAIILPLILGAIGILQGAINRSMSTTIGLTWMCIIGNIITLITCVIFYFVVKNFPHIFPEFIRLKDLTFKWWYIFPGIMGFMFVAGLPFAIYKVGAVKTTVGLIAAQMTTSVLWDVFVEGITINATKGLGIVFALLSVVMITLF
ncbi:DMT family transporter [Bacteriovorax sp. Seq25_V]|uniref:DMT family transporter n=1 Tax=Bacteriovorax sp. Seq25_V TaxID=1201288 RepID=UPI00038A2149|nr:DMT family transporter [Bacteriovorax sp. Seq25_V]EQC46648.1 PF04657 family protein [Bacteriovorax sp. Seq25_V]